LSTGDVQLNIPDVDLSKNEFKSIYIV
jgi:hypothetical protein